MAETDEGQPTSGGSVMQKGRDPRTDSYEPLDERIVIEPTDMVVHVDVAQGTFWDDGDIAVPGARSIVPVVRRVMSLFTPDQQVATLDVHPLGHISRVDSYVGVNRFEDITQELVAGWGGDRLAPCALFDLGYLRDEYLPRVTGRKQTVWPVHGDPFSRKTWFCGPFHRDEFGFVLLKGTDPKCDSYSAYFDNLSRPTGLATYLRRRGARRVFHDGLVYQVCAGLSAIGAAQEGFESYLFRDATGNLPGSTEEMDRALAEAGVRVLYVNQLVAR